MKLNIRNLIEIFTVMNPKEAHELKDQQPVFWFECPVCEQLEAHTVKPNETCSDQCQKKLDEARALINTNSWATSNDLIDYNNTIMYVASTNCNVHSVAKGAREFGYILSYLDREGSVLVPLGKETLCKIDFTN